LLVAPTAFHLTRQLKALQRITPLNALVLTAPKPRRNIAVMRGQPNIGHSPASSQTTQLVPSDYCPHRGTVLILELL